MVPPRRLLPSGTVRRWQIFVIGLKSLARRNAIKINHSSFSSDAQRLIRGLEQAIEQIAAESMAGEQKTDTIVKTGTHAAVAQPTKEGAIDKPIEKEMSSASQKVSGKKRLTHVIVAAVMIIAVLVVTSLLRFSPDNDDFPVVPEKPAVSSETAPQVSKSNQQSDTMTEKITSMQFVTVPKGCFQIRALSEKIDNKVSHEVCVDDYWIGKYEVTQGQWRTIMGANPAKFQKGDNYPVESVSWNDVYEFISRLNKMAGRQFRLPTEAEWEYACRANGKGQYCGGDNIDDLSWYDSSLAGACKFVNDFGKYK